MSQAPPEDVNVIVTGLDSGTGDYQYPPLSAQNEVTQGEANFIDGSGPIFSMYMELASEEDKKMAEEWKADADGILIFTGLFSAAVASLISVSIQDIRQNPQDTSNFYLSNIYRSIADPNISISLPASPPPFSPPNHAIWVNGLWFLSLVISITCALLATLLQQWARRYLKVTQPHYSPHKRARIRAFFAEGVDKFLLPWAVEALPTMLHVSLFLFFSGLAVFLWNVNLTIFKLVLSWVGVCTALYGCITLVPVFRHDSPYHTPLSLPMWHIVNGVPIVIFRILQWFSNFGCFSYTAYLRFRDLEKSYRRSLVQGMNKMAEDTALNSPSEIDTRAFMWTFDCLDEDHELERFFSGLPDFRSSKMVKDPLPNLTWEQQGKLLYALIGLLDRTSSSDLLPKLIKSRRAVICAKAINQVHAPQAIWQVLRRIVSKDQHVPVLSAEIARLVRSWDNGKDLEISRVIQAIVSSVVARAQRRDDLWFAMASDELGVPESVLRNYDRHGDSLSLAILIHVTRQQFSRFWELYWPTEEFSKVLVAASEFNVQDTSPELQHEFCALWNQIVRKMRIGPEILTAFTTHDTLARIRNVYVALHQDTDSAPKRFSASTGDQDDILWQPSAYPLCHVPDHHPDSIPCIHDVSSPNRLTAMERPRVSATSSYPAATIGTTRGIETSVRTMPPTTPATWESTSSVLPTGAAFPLRNNVDFLVHSDPVISSLSLSSSELVLDDITEFHFSMPATTSPDTYPWAASAPELGAATRDEGGSKADSRKDKDCPCPLSVTHAIRENTVARLEDGPPQPPVTEISRHRGSFTAGIKRWAYKGS